MARLGKSTQSPRAYDNLNLTAALLGARFASGANAAMRANLRTALQDVGYRFGVHPSETATGLVAADISFGFDIGDPRRYGVTLTSVAAVNNIAVPRAVAVLANIGGGTLTIFDRVIPLTVAITIPDGVDVAGYGWKTGLQFTGCHGLTYTFSRGFGNSTIANLYISGVTDNAAVSYRGINVPGTLDDAYELYGFTITNVLMTGFDTSVYFRTVRNFTIFNSWCQNTNVAFDLRGKNLVGYIIGCKGTKAAAPGPSTTCGMMLNYVNYTAGAGNVPPEGIVVAMSQLYGFATGILGSACNVFTWLGNDISATSVGIDIGTMQNGSAFHGGTVEMSGAAAAQGVYVRAQNSLINAKVDFFGLSMTGASTTSCVGYQVNSAGNTNAPSVGIHGGVITGMTSYDIRIYNPKGVNTVEGVYCNSSGTTKSIQVETLQGGLTHVLRNQCAKQITVTSTDALAGTTRVEGNIDEASNTLHATAIGWYEEGTWTPTDTSGAALTFTSATGKYTKHGNTANLRGSVTYPVTANAAGNAIGGSPFTALSGTGARQGQVTYSDFAAGIYAVPGSTGLTFYSLAGAQLSNLQLSGKRVDFECTVQVG